MNENEMKLKGVVTICVTIVTDKGRIEREETLVCTGNSLPEIGTVLQRDVYELLVQGVRAIEVRSAKPSSSEKG